MTRIDTGRGPMGQKVPREAKDPKHMALVASLNCCICSNHGHPQNSATQVHHCIHGRHSTRRAPDHMTIPLCEGHHQGMFDISKIAIHQEPGRWQRLYGPDTDYVAQTLDAIDLMKRQTIGGTQ